MARSPEVITGPRSSSPGTPVSQDRGASSRLPERAPVTAKKAGTRRFTSGEKKDYRLQLIADQDILVNGKVIAGEALAAVFHGGLFETEDERVVELMLKSKSYGVHFWDLDEVTAKAQAAAEQAIEQTILAHPEIAKRALERLKVAGGDFEVGKQPEA